MSELKITGAILKSIVPALSQERANIMAEICNKVLPKYQINNVQRFCAFIANVAIESGGLQKKTESLNYSFPRIWDIFKKYFKDQEESKLFTKNSEKLANRVYCNRNGNGNEASGDGYTFRGGGFMQLTGREMFQAYANYLGISIKEAAEKVRTDDYYAMDSAAWFFSQVKKLNDEADAGEFKTICLRINGGLNGYEERVGLYKFAVDYFSKIAKNTDADPA